jgi:hypothetical protein
VHQSFFDSLRDGYTGFNKWYLRAAQAQRKAWCISDGDTVKAICIYKKENTPRIVDIGSPLGGDALKLCTFKIGHAVRGRKLGERLLFTAFKYAVEQDIPYVYLHTFGKEQAMLVSLCEDFGFQFAGKYKGRDDVYLKKMHPPKRPGAEVRPLDYAVEYYPHYIDGQGVEKYIVPIKPHYHNDLFADISDNARGLFAHDPRRYGPQANTIKKAYLSHSNNKNVRPGSLLLFYRSHDRRSVECIGIVEQTYRGREIGKVLPLVSKRTVFSREEIEKLLQKETLIILFRLLRTFSPIRHGVLEKAGIKGQIQRMRQITHEQYEKCFDRSMN